MLARRGQRRDGARGGGGGGTACLGRGLVVRDLLPGDRERTALVLERGLGLEQPPRQALLLVLEPARHGLGAVRAAGILGGLRGTGHGSLHVLGHQERQFLHLLEVVVVRVRELHGRVCRGLEQGAGLLELAARDPRLRGQQRFLDGVERVVESLVLRHRLHHDGDAKGVRLALGRLDEVTGPLHRGGRGGAQALDGRPVAVLGGCLGHHDRAHGVVALGEALGERVQLGVRLRKVHLDAELDPHGTGIAVGEAHRGARLGHGGAVAAVGRGLELPLPCPERHHLRVEPFLARGFLGGNGGSGGLLGRRGRGAAKHREGNGGRDKPAQRRGDLHVGGP